MSEALLLEVVIVSRHCFSSLFLVKDDLPSRHNHTMGDSQLSQYQYTCTVLLGHPIVNACACYATQINTKKKGPQSSTQ
jgi:hypothetical protein